MTTPFSSLSRAISGVRGPNPPLVERHVVTARIVCWVLVVVWLCAGAALGEDAEDPEIGFAGFLVDRYEYPNRVGAYPRVDVTFDEATRLCTERGKRLCTEHEWETACRGPRNMPFGYGIEFIPGRCNTPQPDGEGGWIRDQGTQPSGTFADCGPDHGAVDMVGNVWEWTQGWYDEERGWRVIRGGSWFNNLNLASADGRYGRELVAEFHLDLVGFRCCRDAPDGSQ